MMESKKPVTRWTQPALSSVGSASYSSVHLSILVDKNTWLNRTWVGRLRKLTLFDRIEDDLTWSGYDSITPKYIEDDMVMLMGLTETNAAQIAVEVNTQRSTIFYSLEKWSPQLKTGHRLVWLSYWGRPLHA